MTRVVVTNHSGTFVLRTDRDLPVGNRLLRSAPPAGTQWPPEQTEFGTKLDADRAALAWNLYLRAVNTKRSKADQKKKRIAD